MEALSVISKGYRPLVPAVETAANSTSDGPLGPRSKRRTLVAAACEACRRRKSKVDGCFILARLWLIPMSSAQGTDQDVKAAPNGMIHASTI